MSVINLGDEARDTVTGFTGICVCRTEYISGCARISLQPQVGKDGKIPDQGHFDEPMCVVLKHARVKAKPTNNGGPGDPVPQARATPR